MPNQYSNIAGQIIGKKFNHLTVLSFDKTTPQGKNYLCQCDCGNIKSVRYSKFLNGVTKSCGCIGKHGLTNSKIYKTWYNIKSRCSSTAPKVRKYYLDRGISVCDEWKDNFFAFKDWSYKNGFSEGLYIDRENTNKGYSPSNCRWVTAAVNSDNRTDTIRYLFNGDEYTLSELCRIHNKPYRRVYTRIKDGWDIYAALFTPKLKSRHEARKSILPTHSV